MTVLKIFQSNDSTLTGVLSDQAIANVNATFVQKALILLMNLHQAGSRKKIQFKDINGYHFQPYDRNRQSEEPCFYLFAETVGSEGKESLSSQPDAVHSDQLPFLIHLEHNIK